jgi:hypothetical protein
MGAWLGLRARPARPLREAQGCSGAVTAVCPPPSTSNLPPLQLYRNATRTARPFKIDRARRGARQPRGGRILCVPASFHVGRRRRRGSKRLPASAPCGLTTAARPAQATQSLPQPLLVLYPCHPFLRLPPKKPRHSSPPRVISDPHLNCGRRGAVQCDPTTPSSSPPRCWLKGIFLAVGSRYSAFQ